MLIEPDALLWSVKQAGMTLTRHNGKLRVRFKGTTLSDEWRAVLAENKPRLLRIVPDEPEPPKETPYGLKALPYTEVVARPCLCAGQNYDMFDGCSPLKPRPAKRKDPHPFAWPPTERRKALAHEPECVACNSQ
jgi:hypothetical protein